MVNVEHRFTLPVSLFKKLLVIRVKKDSGKLAANETAGSAAEQATSGAGRTA